MHARPPGRENAGDRGPRPPGRPADTYASLVEVLLDSEAAHPAVALRPGAAQHRQQHESPHPRHRARSPSCGDRAP